MCSNCQGHDECDCTGGAVFAVCACTRGYTCAVCHHDPAVDLADEPDLLLEMVRPELIVEVQ